MLHTLTWAAAYCPLLRTTSAGTTPSPATATMRLLQKIRRSQLPEARNQFYRSAKELLLVELGKHGLGKRDVTASINCFSKVATDEDGVLGFVPEHSAAGSQLTLRADLPTLVVCCAVQHPPDPTDTYNPKRVRLEVINGPLATADDVCWQSCAENEPGF